MITPVVLRDGHTMPLCPTHRALADAVRVEPAIPGAAWTCAICRIHRRLTQGQADAVSVIVPSDSGGSPHVVTRIPSGVVYCDCPAWRFQKNVPPTNRVCKHVERSGLRTSTPRRRAE